MKNLTLFVFGILSFGLLAPVHAANGGQAFLVDEGEQIHVEFQAPNLLRVADSSGQGYMLMRDGKLYTVVNDAGQVMVLDVAAAMSAYGDAFQDEGVLDGEIREVKDFSPTGNRHQIAGIEGEEFKMTFVDGNGDTQTDTMVLSRDARVVALTRTMHEMSKLLLSINGGELPASVTEMEKRILDQNWGVLKQGNDFEIKMISSDTPAMNRFELPAKPMSLPTAGQGSDESNAMAQFLAQKSERQKQRQENKAERAMDQATDKAVDKVVDKVLGKFFN